MRKLLGITILAALVGFTGTAVAEPNRLSRTFEDQATAMEVAKSLVVKSVNTQSVDAAVGQATVALDIARAKGDKVMANDVEELLAAYRVVNLMATAVAAKKEGDNLAAREIRILACKKVEEVAQKLGYLVRGVKNFCSPI